LISPNTPHRIKLVLTAASGALHATNCCKHAASHSSIHPQAVPGFARQFQRSTFQGAVQLGVLCGNAMNLNTARISCGTLAAVAANVSSSLSISNAHKPK
jgi:hypothetical protein